MTMPGAQPLCHEAFIEAKSSELDGKGVSLIEGAGNHLSEGLNGASGVKGKQLLRK